MKNRRRGAPRATRRPRSSRPTPHTPYTLWRCALEKAILSECMDFLARFLTENEAGGRELEDVRVWSKSLPHCHQPHLQTRRRQAVYRLRCKPLGLPRRLAGSPDLGCWEAGSAPDYYLPFRNIIPGKFRLREGGGGGGTGRGREPGAQISTRILFAHPAPASDRAGRGMDREMFSLSGGMHVERKWSSSEPNF